MVHLILKEFAGYSLQMQCIGRLSFILRAKYDTSKVIVITVGGQR